MKKYIAVRGSVDTDYLFITCDDTPLSKKQVQDRIKEYGKKAESRTFAVPHIRFAIHLLNYVC